MHTVLIVDDEPIVREGLAYIVDWEAAGFKIIGTASDGQEGIEKIKALNPDVVLTDIQMPEMDGIEMVRYACEHDLYREFIILSGHSDFAYAKEAMSLGVAHYLLKPIDEEELLDVLARVSEQISLKQQQQAHLTSYQNYLDSRRVRDLLTSRNIDKELVTRMAFDSYCLIACEYEGYHLDNHAIEKVFESHLTGVAASFNHTSLRFALITDKSKSELSRMTQALSQAVQALHPELYILMSDWTVELKALPELYQQIKHLRNKRYIYPSLPIMSHLHLAEVAEKNRNQAVGFDKLKWKENLLSAIQQNKKEKIRAYLNEIAYYYQKNEWRERDIKADIAAIFNFYCDEMEEDVDLPMKESDKRYIISIILSERSLQQTFEFLNEIFIDFSRILVNQQDKFDLVEEMKRYTNKYYHLNLTLQELGKELNYSHSYLGKKFRNEVQMSYRMYLDQVRIDAAKQLIQEDKYLIYEIAEKVGYANSDYFSKKFKTLVGKSPGSFQREWQASRKKDSV
ncbi:response regulator [Fundicoccus ignavus]|nr:response regulator [Fundicoccus ignavus]